MSLLLDLLLVLIALLTVISGVRSGFVRSVMNLITFVCALYCAISFGGMLSDWLYHNWLYGLITANAQQAIEGIIDSGLEQLDLSLLFDNTPQAFLDLISRYSGSYEAVEGIYLENIARPTAEIIRKMAENLAGNTARLLSNALSFGGIFLAVTVVLKIVTWLLDLLFRLPVLNTLNRAAGLLLGLVCGCGYAWIGALILTAAIPALSALIPALPADAAENALLISFLTGALNDAAPVNLTLIP